MQIKVVTQPKYTAAAGLLEIEIAAAFEGWAETNFKVNIIGETMVNATVIVDNQCNVMLCNWGEPWSLSAIIKCHVVENHYHCGQSILCCRKPRSLWTTNAMLWKTYIMLLWTSLVLSCTASAHPVSYCGQPV